MKRLIAIAAMLPLFTVGAALPAPAKAQQACATWAAEMLEDEGGPVLTAWVCDAGRPDAQLLLNCFDNRVWIRYDLSAGAEAAADLEETADVSFTTAKGSVTLPMRFEEMDARHAADVAADAPFVALLRGGADVTIRDTAGRYPERTLSLSGSSAAIGKLVAACG